MLKNTFTACTLLLIFVTTVRAETPGNEGTATVQVSRFTNDHLQKLFLELQAKDRKKRKKYKESLSISISPLNSAGCAIDDAEQRTFYDDWPSAAFDLTAGEHYVQITRGVKYKRKNALSCLTSFVVRLDAGTNYALDFYELGNKSCLVEILNLSDTLSKVESSQAGLIKRDSGQLDFCKVSEEGSEQSDGSTPVLMPTPILTDAIKASLQSDGLFNVVKQSSASND